MKKGLRKTYASETFKHVLQRLKAECQYYRSVRIRKKEMIWGLVSLSQLNCLNKELSIFKSSNCSQSENDFVDSTRCRNRPHTENTKYMIRIITSFCCLFGSYTDADYWSFFRDLIKLSLQRGLIYMKIHNKLISD